MILLLAITNTATYRITEQYIQGKYEGIPEEVKIDFDRLIELI